MNTQNHNEEIFNYLKGNMNEEEKASFERRINNDPKLQEEVEAQKKVMEVVEVGALKDKLDQIHMKLQMRKSSGNRFYLKSAVAVAATFLVVLSFWFMWDSPHQDPQEQLFAAVYFTDPGLPVVMSTTHAKVSLDNAMVEYKLENYQQSFNLLSDLLESNPKNDTIRFYMGVNLFELGEIDRSLSYFEKTQNSDSYYVSEKSEWFIALVQLKNGNYEDAERGFTKISNSNGHLYQQDASNALIMMENLL